jgi:hypothetical protein
VESKVKAGKGDADDNLMHREYRPDYIWVAPISTPAQIRQYRKELYDTVDALPFATVVPAPISGDDDVPEICSDGSDDDPINLTLLSIAQHSCCCLMPYKHKQPSNHNKQQATAPASLNMYAHVRVRTCGSYCPT